MRIMILGASGLIGHQLLIQLASSFEVFGVLHKPKEFYNHELFKSNSIIENIDILDFDVLKGVLFGINPDIVLNCVGITKRKEDINDLISTLEVNSVFPHKLAGWAKKYNKRVIHFSTDCVFDGEKGNYIEESLTSAKDVYGRTKALGEINYPHTLTIRSSFIGQEIFGKTELLEWFLAQNGQQVKGYKRTFYSGVSTVFMTSFIKQIILDFPNLSGLYQLAPQKPISKYELLCIARDAFNLNIDIIPDEEFIHNPTLDASKIRKEINLNVPSWEVMMNELASMRNFYK